MYEINGIVYAGGFEENIKVTDATVTGDHALLLTFSTGEKRVFDATLLTGPVFEPLKDNAVFETFEISHGVITWVNGEIDCAPEYLYEHSYQYDEAIV